MTLTKAATVLNIQVLMKDLVFWIQAVSFLQLPCGSLSPAGKHSYGKARQEGVNGHMRAVCLAGEWFMVT